MPKYSVDEVLEIVQSFTPKEKEELQSRLPSILTESSNTRAVTSDSTVQSSSFSSGGNVTLSGGSVLDNSNKSAGRDMTANTSVNNSSVQGDDLSSILTLLESLRDKVGQTSELTRLAKTQQTAAIDALEAEIQKPEPDKGFIEEAVDGLKKGLEGVQTLAEPTRKVAELVAKAWAILL